MGIVKKQAIMMFTMHGLIQQHDDTGFDTGFVTMMINLKTNFKDALEKEQWLSW